MKKLNYTKLRGLAERMFMDGMKGAAIASELDVSTVTISKWRKDDKWDDRKAELHASPHKIKELLMKELQLMSEGKKSVINADAIAKISKVIESVNDRVSVQIVLTVFKEFDNWMSEQDPELAIKFTEYHKFFLLHKASIE